MSDAVITHPQYSSTSDTVSYSLLSKQCLAHARMDVQVCQICNVSTMCYCQANLYIGSLTESHSYACVTFCGSEWIPTPKLLQTLAILSISMLQVPYEQNFIPPG